MFAKLCALTVRCGCSALQLDNNGLYGTLPSTIVQLDTLAVLSLQYNDLSGTIPDQLFSVTSMQCVWRCWAAG